MTTVDEIIMHADADAIFHAAANVVQWPTMLPHYRWVHVLDHADDGVIVEMAARRGIIPVRWIAVQSADPVQRRVYYRHVGGPTKGMSVVWRIEPLDFGVHVSILHDFTLTIPIINSAIGKQIVSKYFVREIAGRTLQCMKREIEKGKLCGAPLSLGLAL